VAAMSNDELHDRIRQLITEMLEQPNEAAKTPATFLTTAEGM